MRDPQEQHRQGIREHDRVTTHLRSLWWRMTCDCRRVWARVNARNVPQLTQASTTRARPGPTVRDLRHNTQDNSVMRAVVQRVSRAKVTVAGEIAGEIGLGLLVLLGVGRRGLGSECRLPCRKDRGLRIFEDDAGKMNRSVLDVGGAVLVVSQFTLYGDARKGKRPSFDDAAPPQRARELYEYFVEKVRAAGLRCETGQISGNDGGGTGERGPVTILLDRTKILARRCRNYTWPSGRSPPRFDRRRN